MRISTLFFQGKNGTTLFLNRKIFKSDIEKILGTKPGNLRIYELALIHSSASLTLPDGSKINNERLEFLGDSILNCVLSDYLFKKFPEANEGFMTKIRSKIVNGDILNQIALSIGIDKILISNLSPLNNTKKLYGNAFEAFTGAVFIDKGYDGTKKFIINQVIGKYINFEKLINTDNDYKSLVLEWIQKRKLNLSFINSEDYDDKLKKTIFSSQILIDGKNYGQGLGASKKEAEQEASRQAWEKINI
ncbi:MAG TPA: ribonuclease III [Bacteroidales bacterium]|nr:ribonuclease III [Bacteroidales bacterium]HCI55339.1 ribonuclease III [Bacteroidales bacterium]HOU95816.1 ribonuclease III [Bacteroidales bacterium]HQG36912.1 ribonuclease III [Bacteroidales bacterium]HQG52589.1 ribonuclease III [Bacteroidales bacterium]